MATMLMAIAYVFLLSCPPLAALAVWGAVMAAANWRYDWDEIFAVLFFWGALAGIIATVFFSP